jgi:ABC-type Mn2+/Zn2+ transport system ATPase subunit
MAEPAACAWEGPGEVPAIDFDQVTFGYGRIPVLREVNLRIDEGEFVALIGANGSGKTTLMKLGLGLLRPTHGTVRLFGTPVAAFTDWGRIGNVPQRAAADAACRSASRRWSAPGWPGTSVCCAAPTRRSGHGSSTSST